MGRWKRGISAWKSRGEPQVEILSVLSNDYFVVFIVRTRCSSVRTGARPGIYRRSKSFASPRFDKFLTTAPHSGDAHRSPAKLKKWIETYPRSKMPAKLGERFGLSEAKMSELRAGRGLAYVSHITHGGVGVNLQSLAYSF